MASRTSRIELRADPAREQRIRYAAELSRQSLSTFVLDAAAARAEEVIAAASATVVPSEFFDSLWKALDEPPRANPALTRRAKKPRALRQK